MKIFKKVKAGTLSRVLRYIGRYRLLLPVSLLMALISVALTLYVPLLIGEAIDLAIGEGLVEIGEIVKILIFAAALIGITAIANWIMSAVNNRIAYSVTRDMRRDAFEKIQSLSLGYIDSTPHGDVVNRVINDTERFSDGLLLGFTQVFTGVLTIIGTLAFMLVINWKIALVVVLLTPLSILVARFIGKHTFDMFKARSAAEAEAASHIDEMIGNQKTVKAFSHEDESIARFDEITARLDRATLKAVFYSSLTNPTTRFVNNMVYAAVALVGAFIAISEGGAVGMLTVGEFSVLLSYTNQYTKPFNEISGIFAEFSNALASADRVLELIGEDSEVSDSDSAIITDVSGNVSFNDVSFSYTPERPLIEGLTLDVQAGEHIAIVGPTGCGKTTMINLLMRFYDVDSGEVRVDGQDIRGVTRKSLRTSWGMVLQDTWLCGATVRDNIAFGNPDATDEEIIRAAKASHAHSFIKRLSKGYDTVIGDGGEELSAGQRQLICIARIMLALPPMLILDEATFSIDTRTEMKIQDAFGEMMEGRTSFIVAHRLSTIREADKILVMKDGRIIETGTHTDLLARGGFYSELYNSQFAH